MLFFLRAAGSPVVASGGFGAPSASSAPSETACERRRSGFRGTAPAGFAGVPASAFDGASRQAAGLTPRSP